MGAGLFVFGQFVGQQTPSLALLVVGVAVWSVLLTAALIFADGDTP